MCPNQPCEPELQTLAAMTSETLTVFPETPINPKCSAAAELRLWHLRRSVGRWQLERWRPPTENLESSDVKALLGGSWAVITGVISPLIWVIIIVTLLIAPFITTHEPPSTLGSMYPK